MLIISFLSERGGKGEGQMSKGNVRNSPVRNVGTPVCRTHTVRVLVVSQRKRLPPLCVRTPVRKIRENGTKKKKNGRLRPMFTPLVTPHPEISDGSLLKGNNILPILQEGGTHASRYFRPSNESGGVAGSCINLHSLPAGPN